MLKARAERVRAVERWQNSLEALDRMIEFRRSAGTSDDSDLRSWRLDMQTELLRAKGTLRRLERKVKADFQGEFPPWWPRDDD
jgi:septal ring factor EnvC (AmiA/AmiB activator)